MQVSVNQSSECDVEMEALCQLEEAGWYCADMHVHGDLTLAMLRAEDAEMAP